MPRRPPGRADNHEQIAYGIMVDYLYGKNPGDYHEWEGPGKSEKRLEVTLGASERDAVQAIKRALDKAARGAK